MQTDNTSIEMKRKNFSGFNIIHFSHKKKIACSSVLERDYLSESLTNIKREPLHCFLGSRASFKQEEVLKYPLSSLTSMKNFINVLSILVAVGKKISDSLVA